MDLETAEHDVDTSMSRRSLVTLTGAAGLGGLAAALLLDHTALAVGEQGERPNLPSESDTALLAQAMGLELAASDLYRAKLAAGTGDELAVAVGVMAENHQAFAQAISGAIGQGTGEADPDVVDANLAAFTGSDDDFFAAAHSLEQTAAATHAALTAEYESDDAILLGASIALTEERQATVLASLLGIDDLDVLFTNDQPALSLEGDT